MHILKILQKREKFCNLDKFISGVYTDRSNELTNTSSMMEERRTIMTNNNRNVKFMITMGVQVVRGESSQR